MTDDSLGAWVLEGLAETSFIERTGWAAERVTRVAERLQRDRPDSARLKVVVFFDSKETAFTVPGPYVFFSRRLLERCKGDAACAWIVAHEIAHHDLGHLPKMPAWMERYARHRGVWFLVAAAKSVAYRVLGPEREAAADRHAADLCLRAGYHPHDFLQALDAVEMLVRDVGSQEGIYGPDFALLDRLDGTSSVLSRLRLWAWQRAQGYFPFEERRRHIEGYLATVDLNGMNLEREGQPASAAPEVDEAKLAPEERGLFTSPPSRPSNSPAVALELRSGRWLVQEAPNRQIILFDSDDDANRMLARCPEYGAGDGVSMEALARASLGGVYRRWWRGTDGVYYVLETDGMRQAVVSTLPKGPWQADIYPRFCFRRQAGDADDVLPWRHLAYATSAELERMREGDSVVVGRASDDEAGSS